MLINALAGLRGKKEVKTTVDVHSDEEDDQQDDEEEEDDLENDTDKSGEDDTEEVWYPRWNRLSTVGLPLHVPFFAPFLSAAPGFFDAFLPIANEVWGKVIFS